MQRCALKVSQGERLGVVMMTIDEEEDEKEEEDYASCPTLSCGSVASTCLSRQGEMEPRCTRKGEELWWGPSKEGSGLASHLGQPRRLGPTGFPALSLAFPPSLADLASVVPE